MNRDVAYIPRSIDRALDTLLAELPALMLTGPRGCGKTTTALRRAASVLRLDRPDEAAAFRAAPDAVLAAQATPVLVDEWQAVPESMGAVKRAVDARGGAGRFLLTGSIRARLDDSGWPATGRVVPLAMHGLTVAELQHRRQAADAVTQLFSDDDPAVGTLASAPTLVDYVDHALRGGFPDAIGLGDFARSTWYEGYVDQLVRHDVADLAEVRSPTALASLLRAVALNTAGLPSLTTLADAARIDHRTARSYLNLLEDLRIIDRIAAFAPSRLNRMVKTPKYYILDPGMAAHLAGDTRAGTLRSADRLGRLIDTFVLAQLRPLLKLATPSVTAHHLRDGNQTREVDVVLESAAGQIVAVEIKAASTITPRDAAHLAWLRDHLGDAFRRGVVLHTGASTFPLGDRLWAAPIATLWQ
nr:ATP-binding protein [Propionibacterium sp.]